MMPNKLINHLNSIHRLTNEAEMALRHICTETFIKKGIDLHPIGHTCRNVYFIKKGLLRIYYFKDDTDVTENFEFENSMVARADSLFQEF